jgi:hypothetical protein
MITGSGNCKKYQAQCVANMKLQISVFEQRMKVGILSRGTAGWIPERLTV